MYEACKLTCHEWTYKDEVESYKEDIVVEKEELPKKTSLKIGKYWEKIHENNQSTVLKWIMKGHCIEVNNEQQDDIKQWENDLTQTMKMKFRKLPLQ